MTGYPLDAIHVVRHAFNTATAPETNRWLTVRSLGVFLVIFGAALGVFGAYFWGRIESPAQTASSFPSSTSVLTSSASDGTSSVVVTEILTNATGSGGSLMVTPLLRNLTSTTSSDIYLDFRVLFTNGEEFNASSMLLQVGVSTPGFTLLSPLSKVTIPQGVSSTTTLEIETPAGSYSGPLVVSFSALPPYPGCCYVAM